MMLPAMAAVRDDNPVKVAFQISPSAQYDIVAGAVWEEGWSGEDAWWLYTWSAGDYPSVWLNVTVLLRTAWR